MSDDPVHLFAFLNDATNTRLPNSPHHPHPGTAFRVLGHAPRTHVVSCRSARLHDVNSVRARATSLPAPSTSARTLAVESRCHGNGTWDVVHAHGPRSAPTAHGLPCPRHGRGCPHSPTTPHLPAQPPAQRPALAHHAQPTRGMPRTRAPRPARTRHIPPACSTRCAHVEPPARSRQHPACPYSAPRDDAPHARPTTRARVHGLVPARRARTRAQHHAGTYVQHPSRALNAPRVYDSPHACLVRRTHSQHLARVVGCRAHALKVLRACTTNPSHARQRPAYTCAPNTPLTIARPPPPLPRMCTPSCSPPRLPLTRHICALCACALNRHPRSMALHATGAYAARGRST